MGAKLKKSTGKLSISHRSTAYPCSVPGLGRLAGAGRIGLTRATKIRNTTTMASSFSKVHYVEN
jgi:hypothetical protein